MSDISKTDAAGPDQAEFWIDLASDSVQAGFPAPAYDYSKSSLSLNELLIQNKSTTFMIRVEGDSMTGAGILDGDYLVVDSSLEPHDHDIVIANLNGEFTVKELRTGKFPRLVPKNPAFPLIEIKEGDVLTITGVVTGVVRKMNPRCGRKR